MLPTLLLVLATVAAAATALSWRAKRQLLARIRADWGRRRDRARHMPAIAEYHRSRTAADGASGSLDDRTWEDLHLDAVFHAIDRTESTLGQQVLYHRLRTAPVADHLDAFEALVDRLSADVAARERVQAALARLQDPAGYDIWWLAQPDALQPRAWHVVFPVVAAAMLGAMLLVPVWPGALLVVIVGAVVNLAIRIWTARRVGAVVGAFRQIGPLLAAAETLAFVSRPDVDSLLSPLRTERARLARLRTIAGWAGRDTIAAGELAGVLLEYLNLLLLLDANALYFGAHDLRAHGASLLRVVHAVGEIDAAIAVASFRAGSRDWVRPRFQPPGTPAVLSDIRHPLIDEPVPNSIQLGPPHGVLVTGSNMAGKSTFVRTVGVTAVLAQTINTCLASTYEAPVFAVRSCIGRSDDLLSGKSYYIVEVESVLALVRASGETRPHLFLFDELFRGTNAVERIAAAEAVLSALIVAPNGFKPHIVLAATHDAELVRLLHDSYASCHFADAVGDEGLVFDHRLRPGPTTTRNAIALLRLHGAPEAVVTRALARAASLDLQRDA